LLLLFDRTHLPTFILLAATPVTAAQPLPPHGGESQNAAVKYLRADAALRQSYDFPGDGVKKLEQALQSPIDNEDKKLVAAADEALIEFRHGAQMKHCDWAISTEDGPRASTAHRGAIREMVAVTGIRARLRFRDGEVTGGMDDILSGVSAPRHLSTDGSIASVLFAYNAENAIVSILTQNLGRFSRAEVRGLKQQLKLLPSGASLLEAVESEKLRRNDLRFLMRRVRTREQLIGRLVASVPFIEGNAALATQIVDACGGSVRGFSTCLDAQQAFYRKWISQFSLAPDQFEKECIVSWEHSSNANSVVRHFTPDHARLRRIEAQQMTRRALLNAVVDVVLSGPGALHRHTDPYDGQPFSYQSDNGGFRVESRLKDEGMRLSVAVKTAP
jgi:hypothetical protein